MKNLIRNLKAYGLLTVLMVGGLIIAFSAFKAKEVTVADHSYYFMGNASSDIPNVSSWSETPVPTCGSEGSLPCEILIPENQSLEDYLLNTSPAKITQDAASKRD